MDSDNIIISSDTQRKVRVPEGQWLTKEFPVLQFDKIPVIDPNNWNISIFGLVDKAISLSLSDFLQLPQVKVFSDIHCVTTWSKLNNTWQGVSSGEIKKLVKINPESEAVMLHSADGYTTNLLLSDFFDEDVLFANCLDDNPLPEKYGFPLRLVVPRLYYWKSAKWVTGIEFIEKDIPGYWEQRGYHLRGDPWKQERYSSS
jgi:DMSO/TMAO reductase YedYZ molybdopterin-dependent catalytic subunit